MTEPGALTRRNCVWLCRINSQNVPVPAYYCWSLIGYLRSTEQENSMTSPQSSQSSTHPEGTHAVSEGVAKRIVVTLGFTTMMVFFAAAMPAPIRVAWDQFALAMQLKNDPVP